MGPWDELLDTFCEPEGEDPDADAITWQVRHVIWHSWLRQYFPSSVYAPFAPRHVRLWEWFESLEPGVKPPAQVEIWPRGGAKSSSAELGCTRIGMAKRRKFALYVCATQGQANKHVQAIASKFEHLGVRRAVNRYGNSLGWRIDVLRVVNGYNVLALGLDAAGRGVKIEDARPDLIILDDIDERHDTPQATEKKLKRLTLDVLPMGSPDCAVLFIQNRIHEQSIAASLMDGKAEFLLNRRVFHEQAVIDLEYQAEEQDDGLRLYRVTGGTPTWDGQNLRVVESQFNEWGRPGFLREAQHETAHSEDGLWKKGRDIDPFRFSLKKKPGGYLRIAVAVDPNASSSGDDAGIMVGGTLMRGDVEHGVLLEDATVTGGPRKWARAAVEAYNRWEADHLIAEANNGGEMVAVTIGTIEDAPPVELVNASRGKRTRAEPVQSLYEGGQIHHLGVFPELEMELCSWKPGDPSPNRLDANVWLWTKLLLQKKKKHRVWFPGMQEAKVAS